ncbi:hypothetical protein FW774_14965 [Pedobacter sp. BS3]|uniref:hypothetical protein n=1 Tax=Pedobacter sp. BS3 TaxID=2567937 RepID=UPI0011EC145C|nr:hypothetical protein [Pedobacter sp. BS3]TZF82788.1 hypothetical protein FW774_14965 [Pedobacter sp. BS3]
MKLKKFTLLLIAMLCGALFNACEKDYPGIPLNIASVKFDKASYTIEKGSVEALKVTLPLSLPLEEAGSVVINVDNASTATGADFTTDPGISSGAITLNLEKGALEASFTVTSSGNFDENKTLIFKIASATGGIKLANAGTVATINMMGNNPTIPEIIISANSLADFGSVRNGEVSASKSYTVRGSALSSNILVVASDNFEVSLNNTTFSKTVTIDYHTASTTPVAVFVRFAPASGQNKVLNGTIVNYSTGVIEKNVVVSGRETGNVVAGGSLLLNEDFDYGASAGNLKDVAGSNWAVFSGSTVPVKYVTTGLTFSGYAGSGTGGAASSENGKESREDMFRTFASQNSGTIYVAQLINVAAAGSGDFFTSLRDGTAYINRLYVKDNGGSAAFGLGKSSATTAYAPVACSYGTTYLVVTKYDFTSGVSSLFVFADAPPETEPEPAATTDVGSGPAQVGDVIIRQNTTVPLSVTLDGIRVATSWSEVIGL